MRGEKNLQHETPLDGEINSQLLILNGLHMALDTQYRAPSGPQTVEVTATPGAAMAVPSAEFDA